MGMCGAEPPNGGNPEETSGNRWSARANTVMERRYRVKYKGRKGE